MAKDPCSMQAAAAAARGALSRGQFGQINSNLGSPRFLPADQPAVYSTGTVFSHTMPYRYGMR